MLDRDSTGFEIDIGHRLLEVERDILMLGRSLQKKEVEIALRDRIDGFAGIRTVRMEALDTFRRMDDRPLIGMAIVSKTSRCPTRPSASRPRLDNARLIERPPMNPRRRGSDLRSKTETRWPSSASRLARRLPASPAPPITTCSGSLMIQASRIDAHQHGESPAVMEAVAHRSRGDPDHVRWSKVGDDATVLDGGERLGRVAFDDYRQLATVLVVDLRGDDLVPSTRS